MPQEDSDLELRTYEVSLIHRVTIQVPKDIDRGRAEALAIGGAYQSQGGDHWGALVIGPADDPVEGLDWEVFPDDMAPDKDGLLFYPYVATESTEVVERDEDVFAGHVDWFHTGQEVDD